MYDRISVSVALATIITVMAKLGFEYTSTGSTWFTEDVDARALYLLLAGLFAIFFRGKMMHDDNAFFGDLEKGEAFKTDSGAIRRIKLGLVAGYFSWLCWGPAIFFLNAPKTFGKWMVLSLICSTIWLLLDISTRTDANIGTADGKKRPWWVAVNLVYMAGHLCFIVSDESPALVAAFLLFVLVLDWLFMDSLITEIVRKRTAAKAQRG